MRKVIKVWSGKAHEMLQAATPSFSNTPASDSDMAPPCDDQSFSVYGSTLKKAK